MSEKGLEERFLAWIGTDDASLQCALDPELTHTVAAMPKETEEDLVQLFLAIFLFSAGFHDWKWRRYTAEALLAFANDLPSRQRAGARIFRPGGPQNVCIDTQTESGARWGWLHNLRDLSRQLECYESGNPGSKIGTILHGIKNARTYLDACKQPRILKGIGPYCAMRIVRDLFTEGYGNAPGLFLHHREVVESMMTKTPYGAGPMRLLTLMAGEPKGRRLPFADMIVALAGRATETYGRPFTAVEIEDYLCKFSGTSKAPRIKRRDARAPTPCPDPLDL